MANVPNKMTLYSFVGSQWAGVPHLALAEKGFKKSEYDVKEINLLTAENFEPSYLAINPNGTVPSLTAPSLKAPLIDSRDILEYINSKGTSGPELLPKDPATKERVQQLIDFAHSDQVTTDTILLFARNKDEMEAKKASPWKGFVVNRQNALEKYKVELPNHPFYGPKAAENGALYKLYTTEVGPAHDEFFKQSENMYVEFAEGLKKLGGLLVLPYAAGEEVTAADLHLVPWLSHAMADAGATHPKDFAPLEKQIGESVPGFKVCENVRAWWGKINERASFKEVYAELH